MRKLSLILFTAALPVALALAATRTAPEGAVRSAGAGGLDAGQLQATRLANGFLTDSQMTYRPRALDDDLSQEILRRYLEALDGDKLYLLRSDVARFEAGATGFDDALREGRLQPAFDLFDLYQQRVAERIAYARSLLADGFDFSTDEEWRYDREDAAWAADSAELDALWRLSVKSDWLRLKLAGREPEEIRATLDRRYANTLDRVRDLDRDDAFETFMNAYATSIDPHTNYFGPRTAENFRISMSLSLEGIGAVLQRQDEFVVIRTLVPGGPAAMSGRLSVGDRIIAVGEGRSGEMTDVVGWPIDEVVQRIRGAKGTQVRIDVLPGDEGVDGNHFVLTLTRDKIKLEEQAARQRVIEAGGRRIGLVELPTFYLDFEARRRGDPDARSATADVARLLEELKRERVDGVVLDLRGNGGGSLLEAVELSGLFIDTGPVVQVRSSSGKIEIERDSRAGVAWDGPLAVLVDRSSASASEIFAAAMQDYGRALIIGEPTYGKGTVQTLYPDAPDARVGQLKFTIAQFFRIDGSTTQHDAVVPDLQFPVTLDASEYGESTYDNALPATRIPAARYDSYADFTGLLPLLRQRHESRITGDREFQWWREDVAEYRAQRERGTLSLNEAVRRAERDRNEARRQAREAERRELGLESPGNDRADDGLQADERNIAESAAQEEAARQRIDPLLREAAAVLSDAVELLESDRQLSNQVLPDTRQARVWAN
jgi:carboxyl-terminal processing protease